MQLDRIVSQGQAFVEGIDAVAADRRQGLFAADDFVADKGVYLIDELVVEEGPLNLAAPFDEDALQALLVQQVQSSRQIDVTILVQRSQQDGDAHVFQFSHLFYRAEGGRHDDGRRRLIRQDEGIERNVALRIHNDAYRLVRLVMDFAADAAGQQRIVELDRVDADEDAVVKGLEIESAAEAQIHEKITTEILLDFSGDHEKLIGKLWEKFDGFSGGVQLAVLNYIRFQSGQWKDEMLAVMMDEERDKELRFSAIRYFAKYPWEKAEKFIIDLALSEDETKWEGSAICASALASYSGEEVIEALRRSVHSRNWYVRYNAAESLQKLGMNYEKLLDIIRGGDRYAREMVMYRLEENELMKGGEEAK